MYSIVAPCNYLWFLLLVPEVCLINVKPYNNWWFARPHRCLTKIPPDEIRLVVWWFESHKLYKGRRWCQHRLLIQLFVYLPKPFAESQVIIVNPHCIIQGCRPGVQCECLEYLTTWRGKSHHVWRIQISVRGKWAKLSSFIQLTIERTPSWCHIICGSFGSKSLPACAEFGVCGCRYHCDRRFVTWPSVAFFVTAVHQCW